MLFVTAAMGDFFEFASMFGQELEVFRSSLARSWFTSEGTDVNELGRANADELSDGNGSFARLCSAISKAFMACHY